MADALDAVIDAMRSDSEALAEKATAEAAKRIAEGADAAAADVALQSPTVTASDYQRILDTYRARLKAAAVEDALPSAAQILARLLPKLALAMGGQPSPLVLAATQKVIDYYRSIIGDSGALTEPILREALGTAITEPVSVTDLARTMRDGLTGRGAAAVGNQIRTALQVLDQTAINESAKGLGFTLWLYAGPDDVATRPFCDEMVDKVFPEAAIKESRNGQMPNVFMSRGGFNCRHRLRPISATVAKGLGLPIIQPYRMQSEAVGKRVIVFPVSG